MFFEEKVWLIEVDTTLKITEHTGLLLQEIDSTKDVATAMVENTNTFSTPTSKKTYVSSWWSFFLFQFSVFYHC